jgi:hypothetical protein
MTRRKEEFELNVMLKDFEEEIGVNYNSDHHNLRDTCYHVNLKTANNKNPRLRCGCCVRYKEMQGEFTLLQRYWRLINTINEKHGISLPGKTALGTCQMPSAESILDTVEETMDVDRENMSRCNQYTGIKAYTSPSIFRGCLCSLLFSRDHEFKDELRRVDVLFDRFRRIVKALHDELVNVIRPYNKALHDESVGVAKSDRKVQRHKDVVEPYRKVRRRQTASLSKKATLDSFDERNELDERIFEEFAPDSSPQIRQEYLPSASIPVEEAKTAGLSQEGVSGKLDGATLDSFNFDEHIFEEYFDNSLM